MGAPNPEYQIGLPFPAASIQNVKRQILSGAQTLTVAQSGSLCLFNAAAGYTFTLPIITADNVGTWFEFFCSVTNTSVAAKILTGAASSFLVGAVLSSTVAATPSATLGPKAFSFDGATHVACTMGGTDTTAGGVIGTRVKVLALSATQWQIDGVLIAAGTIVTPAATS